MTTVDKLVKFGVTLPWTRGFNLDFSTHVGTHWKALEEILSMIPLFL
jgi:hypothetical protein